jgi:ATP-binding cassette subfamily B protein
MTRERISQLARRLTPYVGESPWRIAGLVGSSVGAGLAEAAALIVVVQIAVTLSSGESSPPGPLPDAAGLADLPVSALLVIAAATVLVRLGLHACAAYLAARMSSDVLTSLRKEAFGAFVSSSWSLQSQEREGQLQDIMTTHVNKAATAVLFAANAVVAGFNFLILAASALSVNVLAAVASTLVAGTLFLALRPVTRLGRRYSSSEGLANLQYASSVSQAVSLAREVKVFDVGAALKREVGGRAEAVAEPYFRGQLLTRLQPVLYQSVALLLVVGGLAAVDLFGTGNIAALGAVVLLLVRSVSYAQLLQLNYHLLQGFAPYIEQVERTRAEYVRAKVKGGTRAVGAMNRIALNRVSFSYQPGVPVLRDISFQVERGEVIGIVGPSGVGKSTLLQVLLRLREPSSGRYLIDGADAREFRFGDWYAKIAFVPQEPRLLQGTVSDNIRFFRDWIEPQTIELAAREAHIEEEVLSWPQGYETEVGDHGRTVSGGQRQRIGLARALAGHPQVLLLDEPMSALDMRSEELVQETLRDIKGTVSLFIVAHRLSTLRICDRVMVLASGRIQSFDRPSVLAETSPFYRRALELSSVIPERG